MTDTEQKPEAPDKCRLEGKCPRYAAGLCEESTQITVAFNKAKAEKEK